MFGDLFRTQMICILLLYWTRPLGTPSQHSNAKVHVRYGTDDVNLFNNHRTLLGRFYSGSNTHQTTNLLK